MLLFAYSFVHVGKIISLSDCLAVLQGFNSGESKEKRFKAREDIFEEDKRRAKNTD